MSRLAAPPPEAGDRPPVRKANILAVDDQPANLLALEAILADLGHNLVKASSGEEALRRLLDGDFAVILLDVRMPGLDGYQTARLIRGRDRTRHTPILFVTAHDPPGEAVLQAFREGAADYLVKPLVPDVLRAKVAKYVQLHLQAELGRLSERQAFERRLTEENSRRGRELFRAAFVHNSVGMALTDLTGRFLEVNPALCELTGYPEADLLATGIPAITHPDDVEANLDLLQQLLTGQVPRFTLEKRYVRKDGTVVWVENHVSALRDRDGRTTHFIVISLDLTGRKQMERDLHEAGRRKDEFLAMLAHELRNPLAPLRNALHALRLARGDDPALEPTRRMMERQIQHLSRLVDDLVDVSRLTRGKIQLRKEPVDLALVVTQALESARPALDARGHRLEVSFPAGPVCLEADPARLVQVLVNLLDNAAKYTEPGGRVELTAAVEASGEVALRVRDTGEGIPADLLPHVFDLFSQGERSLDRSRGGLGLGLALVRRLVQMHGGRVAAHSDGPGTGSEFSVFLPAPTRRDEGRGMRDEGQQTSPSALASSLIPRPSSLRVLVVDDNVDGANSLSLLVRLWGHQVCVVHDGEAAWQVASARPFDVLVLDIGLPGLDGYELARRVRRLPGGDRPLLVAVTGYGRDDDRRRSREAGFDVHLVKPVDPTVLEGLLRETAPRG